MNNLIGFGASTLVLLISHILTGRHHVSMQMSRTFSGLTNLLFNRGYASPLTRLFEVFLRALSKWLYIFIDTAM